VLDDRALQAGLFHSDDLRRRLAALAGGFDLAILQTVRTGGVVAALDGAPLAVDLIDSLSLNFERRARFDRPWLRPLLRHEARRLARDERRLVERSCFASLVCPRDRDHVAAALPGDLASRLSVVPLTVSRMPAPAERPRAIPFRICITGNLGYFPTAHGAIWLLEEVWPRLRARMPEAKLRIAGSRPTRPLREAARRAGAELVVDPPDLDVELSAASAAAVPLFAGSGVAVKLLEALVAGVPAVTTPWAAAGLEPELAAAVGRAESAEEWVEAIAAIRDRPDEAARKSATLAEAVRRLHSAERVSRELQSVLARVPRR
jgi:glycosyltransferase involved in cell wall biosynthesis